MLPGAGLPDHLRTVQHHFTDGGIEHSALQHLMTRASSSTDPNDNSQVYRSVYVSVSYKPCGADGNARP